MPQAIAEHTSGNPFRNPLVGNPAAIINVYGYGGPPLAVRKQADDAKLIRLCAEFDALERRINELSAAIEGDDELDEAAGGLKEEQEALLPRILELRAVTFAGVLARARTLALWQPQDPDDVGAGCVDGAMISALLRDLLGMAAQ